MHPVRILQEQVNDESVLLVDWMVGDGSEVKAGQPIAIIETSKATNEVDAPQAGYLRHGAAKGTEVRVGAVLCYIADDPAEVVPVEKAAASPTVPLPLTTISAAKVEEPMAVANGTVSTPVPAASPGPAAITRFSRKALEIIEQHGLSKSLFDGKGLVRESDVMALVNTPKPPVAAPEAPPPSKSSSASLPPSVPAAGVPFQTQELPRMKRIEARYLAFGQQNTLTSVVSVICPTSGLKAAVALQPDLAGSSLPIVIFETARLLRKYRAFNAFHHDGKVNYYDQVNIGFAVDSGRGLKVCVIPQADKKGIVEIAREVENLLLLYVNDTIPAASLASGTFTITDLSGDDVFLFHPLINQGQAAILGIGAEYLPPGSRKGLANLILSFDHQVAEGRMAAGFLRELRDRIGTYELALQASGKPQLQTLACAHCQRSSGELAGHAIPLLEEVQSSGEKTLICRDCLMDHTA